MSDLAAAAAALNAPEAIVQRSAEARAAATGTSVDEVLAAWAGGGSAPATSPTSTATSPTATAATPPPAAAATSPTATGAPTETPAAVPETAAAAPTPQAPADAPAAAATSAPTGPPATTAVVVAPAAPPILEGRRERPFTVMIGAAGALLLALVAGLLAPSIPEEGTGVRTSEIAFSEVALDGRDVYRSLGCEGCHSQLVRPVVIDAGLGPVTLSDTNQELGLRRYGPDLSNVGRRITEPATLGAIVAGAGSHPAYGGLAEEDIGALTAYLMAVPPAAEEGAEGAEPGTSDTGDDAGAEGAEPSTAEGTSDTGDAAESTEADS